MLTNLKDADVLPNMLKKDKVADLHRLIHIAMVLLGNRGIIPVTYLTKLFSEIL